MGIQTSRSQALFSRAKQRMPGGVNSPVRAFRGVGGDPIFFDRGEGAWAFDVDGNRYVDFVGSWGPLIVGHSHPAIIEAVTAAARKGTTFGAPHAGEVELADLICSLVPSIEKFASSRAGQKRPPPRCGSPEVSLAATTSSSLRAATTVRRTPFW